VVEVRQRRSRAEFMQLVAEYEASGFGRGVLPGAWISLVDSGALSEAAYRDRRIGRGGDWATDPL
jgi:hypothetical protein